jgi:hypothetical protein
MGRGRFIEAGIVVLRVIVAGFCVKHCQELKVE